MESNARIDPELKSKVHVKKIISLFPLVSLKSCRQVSELITVTNYILKHVFIATKPRYETTKLVKEWNVGYYTRFSS